MALEIIITRFKHLIGRTIYISVDDTVEVETIQKHKTLSTFDGEECIDNETTIRTEHYSINMDTKLLIDIRTGERRVAERIKIDDK